VIIGPYSTERGFSKTKGEIFVFNVLNNQTYKLDYHIKPSMYLEQRDLLEIVREYIESICSDIFEGEDYKREYDV